MSYAAGVDVGSTQTKAVIIDESRRIVGRALIDTGANVVTAAETAFAEALADAGILEPEVEYIVGTGAAPFKCFPALEPWWIWAARTRRRFASTRRVRSSTSA